MKVRKHIYFSGQVQGVGFRYSATYLAAPLGLTGWVKNLWDGRVEMEVQGDETAIWEFLAKLRDRRYIYIEDMDVSDVEVIEESRFRAISY
ncbi:MAG: acylphosphatase [Oscillospiraceae bacterium]|nr:acylphosphatase [Oscillospiraceae bacterium]